VQGFSFPNCQHHRPLERRRIDGAQDLDAFAGVVSRVGRIELLAQPDPGLCRR
jgi:hypothetical protein